MASTFVESRGAAVGRGSTARVLSILRPIGEFVGMVLALLLVWQAATMLMGSQFFPTPVEIFSNSRDLFFSGPASHAYLSEYITFDTAQSLWRLLVGFALGSAWGVVIGVVIGRSRIIREASDPVIEFLRAIPATATLPLFIIVLGADDRMRVAFIAYGVSWFVLVNTANGVASIHPTLLDVGRAFRLSRAAVFFRLVLPAAAPKIFAGLRISLTGALLLTVAAEFMLATNGYGYQLVIAQQTFRILDMWSWMVLMALLGFVLNTILEAVENTALRWHHMSRAQG